MTDDTPETILTNVVAVLEEHTRILQQQQQAFEQFFRETAQRLHKLESADSLASDDARFVKDVSVRLKAISTTIKEKL